ncbi:Actin-like protein arp9 (SWI/SNF complex component arp9) [Stylosanthes scabra]|uniref:Actin-like protein arp9 (SWI/SNF complex component arp9) n=1 Tax=Stylosanthes scabra TaxID=79078 RepID=A0ABU6TN55_9FABA|nr:Actin-like protein arp9 (SWI/SNF complex component arp9) [Stylosanthes scabra]
MDYLKTALPSQIMSERGSNLVVINPGSANIRIGLASQDNPFNIPHCIARHTKQVPRRNVQDQMLNSQVTTAQHMEREKAYDVIASILKIPFLDEEAPSNAFPRKMGRVDGHNPHIIRKDLPFSWTNVYEEVTSASSALETSSKDVTSESLDPKEDTDSKELHLSGRKFREFICGEEALRISPTEPYCLNRPIRRGHLNISQHYSMQQVLEDLHTIWDWILVEKLHIPHNERNMYSAVLVLPETFDNREIKEMLSLVLQGLCFGSAVVHQEGLAAVFGNGLSTACVVNIGAQVTSMICIEDGGALPTTVKTLPFGGEDISRCLLWTQRHHQTWPQIRTDMLTKPIDLLMLNQLKETYCEIKEGEHDAVAVVHSYEDRAPAGSHKTRLTALNVPPMGLFYPTLFVPEVYPPPPRNWFNDYEYMLEEPWQMEYTRPDTFYPNVGRIDIQRKLFCSIQLTGGVALTNGLVPALEERVLHAIPPNEAIDTVEVLQSRMNPTIVPWKGGAILGVLDLGRDAWINREDWIQNGIHVGSNRKYKDSYYIQAQAMCYLNS